MTLTATRKTITTGRIYTRAMLVKLRVEMWGNTTALPKELVAEFAALHGINASDAAKYHRLTQHKVDPKYLKDLSISARALRGMHVYLTAPWSDEGSRILSVNGHSKYKTDMRPLMDTHRANVKHFVDNVYEQAVEESKIALNGLAKHIDYPHPEVIRHEFSSGITYRELPRANDFRCDLDAEDIAAITADNSKEDLATLEASARYGYEEAIKLIKHMVERLSVFCRVEYTDPKTGVVKTREENGFHASLVGNIEDFLRILPGLNFMEDERLDSFAREIRTELCRFTAGDLKKDDAARESTLEVAEDILARMSAYI